MSDSNKDQQIESLEEKVTHLSRMLVKSFGYADQDPDTFLQNARRTTEAICRFMYTKELGEPKSRMMLNDYGRELLQKKIIPDKIAGYVVEPNGKDIADGIRDYFENNRMPAFTEGMKKEKQKYDWRIFVDEVIDLYKKI